MFSLNRFNSKELALAYVSAQKERLSPAEFLSAVTAAELSFSRLLNSSQLPEKQSQPAYSFES